MYRNLIHDLSTTSQPHATSYQPSHHHRHQPPAPGLCHKWRGVVSFCVRLARPAKLNRYRGCWCIFWLCVYCLAAYGCWKYFPCSVWRPATAEMLFAHNVWQPAAAENALRAMFGSLPLLKCFARSVWQPAAAEFLCAQCLAACKCWKCFVRDVWLPIQLQVLNMLCAQCLAAYNWNCWKCFARSVWRPAAGTAEMLCAQCLTAYSWNCWKCFAPGVSWPAAVSGENVLRAVFRGLQLELLKMFCEQCLAACSRQCWKCFVRIAWRPTAASAENGCCAPFGGLQLELMKIVVGVPSVWRPTAGATACWKALCAMFGGLQLEMLKMLRAQCFMACRWMLAALCVHCFVACSFKFWKRFAHSVRRPTAGTAENALRTVVGGLQLELLNPFACNVSWPTGTVENALCPVFRGLQLQLLKMLCRQCLAAYSWNCWKLLCARCFVACSWNCWKCFASSVGGLQLQMMQLFCAQFDGLQLELLNMLCGEWLAAYSCNCWKCFACNIWWPTSAESASARIAFRPQAGTAENALRAMFGGLLESVGNGLRAVFGGLQVLKMLCAQCLASCKCWKCFAHSFWRLANANTAMPKWGRNSAKTKQTKQNHKQTMMRNRREEQEEAAGMHEEQHPFRNHPSNSFSNTKSDFWMLA